MPELLIPLFILYLIFMATIMKKSTTPPNTKSATESVAAKEESASEAQVKEPVTKAKSAKASKPATPKPAAKAKAVKPAAVATTETEKAPPSQPAKTAKKTAAKATVEAAGTPDLTLAQRIGLTAGSIWHYLSQNGPTSVAKMVKELPEEEKVIQRSIGWLAQEGKITLETADKVETVALSENR